MIYFLGAYTLFICWAVYWRGDFRLEYNPRIAPWVRKLKAVAVCFGARGYLGLPKESYTPAQLKEIEEHEGDHYRAEWRRWGPLFLPLYFILLLWFGYDKHPWEQHSRRAAGEPER